MRSLLLLLLIPVTGFAQIPSVEIPSLGNYGTWRGPADHIILDGADDDSHKQSITITTSGKRLELQFPEGTTPSVQCGDELTVSGARQGDVIAVSSSKVFTSSSRAEESCSPIGEQKTAVLMVNFPTLKSSLSLQQVDGHFFGPTGRSLKTYWNEVSYGKTTASGDVLGWFTLDRTYTCDEYYSMLEAAVAAASPVVDFKKYRRLFIIFPQSGSCRWSGISTAGCSAWKTPDGGHFVASVAWLPTKYMSSSTTAVKLIAHEAGHGLGLYHARSRKFSGQPIGSQQSSGAVSEYGDKLSAMGALSFGHYAASHKATLGWLSGASNIRIVNSSSVHTIQPLEVSPAGLQALKVQRGTGSKSWLWIESRRKLGDFDSTLSASAFNGVLIRLQASIVPYTDLLDFEPSTSSTLDASLNVGQTWVDPYSNLTLRVLSGDDNGVTVAVDYGPTTCTPVAPKLSMQPSSVTANRGSTASFYLVAENRDSYTCPASTFSISAPSAATWTTSVPTPKATLAPGGQIATYFVTTVPAPAAPGNYPFTAVLTRGDESTMITGTIVVP